MHTLENDQLCVTISDHGAELSGILIKRMTERFCGMQIRHTGNAMLRFFFRM